jgi:hypothetical protein
MLYMMAPTTSGKSFLSGERTPQTEIHDPFLLAGSHGIHNDHASTKRISGPQRPPDTCNGFYTLDDSARVPTCIWASNPVTKVLHEHVLYRFIGLIQDICLGVVRTSLGTEGEEGRRTVGRIGEGESSKGRRDLVAR